jgi:tetratricopeptide (TPR) repeat protein
MESGLKRLRSRVANEPENLQVHLALAEQYHEMVYLGLASRENESTILLRAIEALSQVLTLDPQRSFARVLALKCELKLGRPDQALEHYETLRSQGYRDEGLILAYLEILYMKRKWREYREELQRLYQLGRKGAHRKIAKFWFQFMPTSDERMGAH